MKVIRALQSSQASYQKVRKIQVTVPNFSQLESKLARFPEKFAVISDFDFTMSRYKVNGHSISTIHLLRSLLPSEVIKECDRLFAYYHPIELDFNLDARVRERKMEEWWNEEYGMIAKSSIFRQQFLKAVEENDLFLRFGVKEMFAYCKEKVIPVHVLSAGIGNFIEIVLGGIGVQCEVRSNFFRFDEGGKICGFNVPLIHSANKGKSVEDLEYEAVVVIGDMPSDIASVPKKAEHALLIGFLNDTSLYNPEDFSKRFDIIIENDGDFSLINHTIKLLHEKLPK